MALSVASWFWLGMAATLMLALGACAQGAAPPATAPAPPPAGPRKVGLLIRNGQLVTMDAALRVLPRGTLAIDGSRIVAVGGPELAERFAAETVLDAGGDLVLPGLINTHTHVSMTLFRGLGDEVPDRLRRFIFPLEKAVIDAEHVYRGALLGIVEMVRGGVTTFADMYYFEDQVARAAKQVGLRALLGETVIGFPAPDASEPYGGLDYARRFIQQFAADELITPALAPHAPYTLDSEHLKAVARTGRELGVPILTHLAETQDEIDQIRRQFDQTPVEYLDAVGLLDDRLLAAHCIFLNDSDIELLRRRSVGISHNPISNAKAGKGVAPVVAMLEAGLEVGLGTDGPMSGNTLDLVGVLGFTAKIHKLAQRDRRVLPAAEVLRMATRGGAAALNMEAQIGSLEVGKLADVIIVDRDSVNMVPLYDVYSALVYAAAPADVHTSIVHGRIIMRQRRLLTVDVDRIKADVLALTAKIAEQAEKL